MSEVPPKPQASGSIPQSLVRSFVDGSFRRKALEGRQQNMPLSALFYRSDVTLPSGQTALFEMRYDETRDNRVMRFMYFTPRSELLASMMVNVTDTPNFTLPQRLVELKARRQGIGSHMLQQIGGWVAEVARQRAEPITLSALPGQYDVLGLLGSAGFQPDAKERALYEDIMANAPTGAYHLDAENFVYRLTPTGEPELEPVRITMSKTYDPTPATGTSPA